MGILTVLLIIFSVLLFILVNYYIGNTGWKYYVSKITLMNIKLYWTMFIILSLTYMLPFIPLNYIPLSVRNIISRIGAYWLSIVLYSFVFFLAADILSLLIVKIRKRHYLFSKEKLNKMVLHNIAIIIVIFIISYGIYRAYYPTVTHYNVEIQKNPRNLSSINIVMVSDIHIGNIIGKGNLVKMVDKVNSMRPDIIVLCGDIINNSSRDFRIQNADVVLRGLNAKYGVYAVPGNHDYYDKNDMEYKFQCYKSSGITLLRDNYAKIDDSFYIVGRDDIESKLVTNKNRKSIDKLLEGLDHSLPIIVLDHQPSDTGNEEKSGADLQLSGHTHGGQTLISNFLSKNIYHELVYGNFKVNNLTVIVTSGYGTWGIPMRTGSRAEIVDINIRIRK